MAIHMYCPHCHERLEDTGHHCARCGMALPPGVLSILSAAAGGTMGAAPHAGAPLASGTPAQTLETLYHAAERRTATPQHSTLRPWLAATLSLLCGLGQLYNGQIVKGVVLLSGAVVAVCVWPFLLGKIAAGILWLYAISDAYLVARNA